MWALQECLIEGDEFRKELVSAFHKTIKKVTEDIESLKFNTAIAAMMALLNDINSTGKINRAELKTLLLLLNPFAPHITEEMYLNSFGEILNEQPWPEYDEKLCVEDTVEIVLQVNGRIKAKMNVVKDGVVTTQLHKAACHLSLIYYFIRIHLQPLSKPDNYRNHPPATYQ